MPLRRTWSPMEHCPMVITGCASAIGRMTTPVRCRTNCFMSPLSRSTFSVGVTSPPNCPEKQKTHTLRCGFLRGFLILITAHWPRSSDSHRSGLPGQPGCSSWFRSCPRPPFSLVLSISYAFDGWKTSRKRMYWLSLV